MIKASEIEEVVRKYNNGEPVDHKLLIISDDDPDYDEKEYIDGPKDYFIIHRTETENIELVFGQGEQVKALHNEYSDEWDYDKIVGYRVDGGEIVYL